jgi:hypothetical protein
MSRRRHKKRPQKHELRRDEGGGGLRKAAIVLVGVAVLSACLAAALMFSGVIGGGGAGPKTVAIVDQLSLTQPNPDFAASATSLLEQAGYAVDYYPGEEVTVEFYTDLPAHDYDLIVFRVHSGLVREVSPATGNRALMDYVSLFTGEPYSDEKYGSVEAAGRLGLGVGRYYEGGEGYFGITPYFIDTTMQGRFDKTTIILMGCDGLRSDTTAEAFLRKGAGTFVGWSGRVSAAHTDAATERLLEHLVIDRLTPGKAVTQTMAEVGRDPQYSTELRIYPPQE